MTAVMPPEKISIHALRVEGDYIKIRHHFCPELFLSTPSVWRATTTKAVGPVSEPNFYPRPPCGGRRECFMPVDVLEVFLSTPSVWRATFQVRGILSKRYISIHALRVEGDKPKNTRIWPCWNFYPRPPCGGRPLRESGGKFYPVVFLSTPSVWRATALSSVWGNDFEISIHALRVEGDGNRDYRHRRR